MTEAEFYKEHHKKVYVPYHPYANKNGHMQKHRLEAEEDCGRYILPTEIVHHHYLSKGGYYLAVCKNQIEHKEMHTREEAFRYSGHWDWRRCSYCKEYDDPKNLNTNIGIYHQFCKSEYNALRRLEA